MNSKYGGLVLAGNPNLRRSKMKIKKRFIKIDILLRKNPNKLYVQLFSINVRINDAL